MRRRSWRQRYLRPTLGGTRDTAGSSAPLNVSSATLLSERHVLEGTRGQLGESVREIAWHVRARDLT